MMKDFLQLLTFTLTPRTKYRKTLETHMNNFIKKQLYCMPNLTINTSDELTKRLLFIIGKIYLYSSTNNGQIVAHTQNTEEKLFLGSVIGLFRVPYTFYRRLMWTGIVD